MTRFVRCIVDGEPVYGVIEGEEVAVIEPHPFSPYRQTGRRVPVAGLRLLAPVIPSKIVAVGRNYVDPGAVPGAARPAEPPLFMKPSTAVIGPGDPLRLPTDLSDDIAYEGEIAVVIGALISRVTPEVAEKAILGVTCANDVTLRDVQLRENQWVRAKGFDGACPLGPAIATGLDLSALRIRTFVDGELRQDGVSSQMLFDIPRVVSEISQAMTLLPGDVVLTGSPAGADAMRPGQRIRIEIDGVGALENPVVDRNAPVA